MEPTNHPAHPAHVAVLAARSVQNRAADRVTRAAGSMAFVYLHAAWFMLWIFVLAVEPFPFGLLTMLVSLEAIFLSTFVMVSQNRQGEMAARQAAHDHVIVRAIAEKVGVDVDGS